MHKRHRTILLFPLFILSVDATAQVELSGIFDFAFLKGGDGSTFERNELFNGHANFLAQRLQLFVDASIDENITFTAKLQNNIVFGDRLKELEVQLAYLSILGLGGMDLNVSAGRILTPFGLFARRQLSPDNPLIGFPLFFYYQQKVSPSLGYNPGLVPGDPYGGLSTMYVGGYYTGAEVFGSLGAVPVTFDAAVMNSPLSLFSSDLNLAKRPSYQGRIGISPAMFLEVGVSGSYGPFMDENLGGFRPIVEDSAAMDLGRYTQSTLGVDVTFDWLYYRLTAEYIDNRWKAPFITTSTYPYSSAIPFGTHLDLGSREVLLDARVDVPWVIGLFLAGRFNLLECDEIDDPLSSGSKVRWDNTIRRITAGAGYKISRRVLLKVNYDWIRLDVTPRPNLDRWGMQLSASM